MIYRVVWLLFQGVFRVLVPRRVTGAEHVPASGAVILASNHLSSLDPPVVGTAVWRPCAYMAKEELFHNRWFAAFIRRLYAFPVKRGAGDRAALKKALDLLAAGWAVVLFPEGTRSETGALGEPELGVAMLAYRSGAPVVPVYVRGTGQVLPKQGGIRPGPISVRYGPPLRFAGGALGAPGEKPGREEYARGAHAIMEAIAALRDAEEATHRR